MRTDEMSLDLDVSRGIPGVYSAENPLARRVRNSLQSLGYSRLSGVECASNGSTIVLHGTISTFHLKQIAQTIAGKVPGVYRVVNDVHVTDSGPATSW